MTLDPDLAAEEPQEDASTGHSKPKLETRKLSAWFGAKRALDSVSLRFPERLVTAIIGPSGCGKSTLLRLASGLESATSGAIEVAARATSYVFQDATLLEWRSAMRNVELVGELESLVAEHP